MSTALPHSLPPDLPLDLPAAIEAALTGAARALIKDLADAALPITLRIRAIKLLLQLRRDLIPATPPATPPDNARASSSGPVAPAGAGISSRTSRKSAEAPSHAVQVETPTEITNLVRNATCEPIQTPEALEARLPFVDAADDVAQSPEDPFPDELFHDDLAPEVVAALPTKLRKRYLARRESVRRAQEAKLRCHQLIAQHELSQSGLGGAPALPRHR